MGVRLRGFVRGNLRLMARQNDYFTRNPAERERRRASLRALLALPPSGRECLERRELPGAEALVTAATRAGVPVEFVEEACAGFLWFFSRGGLTVRPSSNTNGQG